VSNLLTAGLAYDPYFYANAALRILYKRLGLAFFVDRSLEQDKASTKGSTIQLRRPQTFSATSMPIAEASIADVSPTYSNLVINQWQGQGFRLTDKERTLSPERFITEHITPVAISIADAVDQSIAALSLEIPWIVSADASTPINDFANIRQTLFNSKAPIVNSADYAYMVDGVLANRYEKQQTFIMANTAGDDARFQRDGVLGNKFGFAIFANQNATTFTSGSAALTSPVTGTAGAVAGASQIIISGSGGSGNLNRGTVITITGDSQLYAVTTTTAMGSTGCTVPVSPNVAKTTADGTSLSFNQTTCTSMGLAFHRDAFALVMQPLEDPGPGILSATVRDEITGLTLRARIWGSGGSGATFWTVDGLWGVKTKDPNLAVRIQI